MEMENINNLMPAAIERLKSRSNKTNRSEYEYLWVKVSFALTRGGNMRSIGARAFGVFMVLRAYMNKEQISYPSLKKIAWESKLSINTVKKEIDKLILGGWIKKVNRRNKRGMYETTNYQIIENNFVRGTNSKSFLVDPVLKVDNGDPSYPLSKNHYGELNTKNN